MPSEQDITLQTVHRLRDHGLRSTQARRLVLGALLRADSARSAQQLEPASRLDRVTLYRTLKAFEAAGLVHTMVDSDGVKRFVACAPDSCCEQRAHHHEHAHFECSDCGRTTCLPESSAQLPALRLPSGFRLDRTSVLLTGRCASCV